MQRSRLRKRYGRSRVPSFQEEFLDQHANIAGASAGALLGALVSGGIGAAVGTAVGGVVGGAVGIALRRARQGENEDV